MPMVTGEAAGITQWHCHHAKDYDIRNLKHIIKARAPYFSCLRLLQTLPPSFTLVHFRLYGFSWSAASRGHPRGTQGQM